MCGIIGYIGNKKANNILINGLQKLEYRGYDSAGIATLEENKIEVMKDKGRVKNLYNIDGINDLKGTIGIAHTRWATHGKPSTQNSHPHLDNTNSIAVVHNGIIENYNEIKESLINKGYKFQSQTDTEVIPNLISYYYNNDEQNDNLKFIRAVQKTCKDLKGSYAINVISKYCPDQIIVAKKDSPLIIGKGQNENYIASDIPAILSYTNEFYFLKDDEFAIISKSNIVFFDNCLNEIKKEPKNIELSNNSVEKDGFEDYMLKEIYEQPKSIRETIGTTLNSKQISFDGLLLTKDYLKNINQIYIVACGTAMHAGLGVKSTFEKLCKIPVNVEVASEFRYRNPLINEKTLCIYISQSGETADTIAALKLAKSKGAKTIAVSNVIESSITREADFSVYTHAGPEIAVASTKAYTAQLVLLNIMAIYFAEILDSYDKTELNNLKAEILGLPEKIELVLKNTESIKNFAKKIYNEKNMFFIGRGIDYAVAMEGSLKLKEISYIHSEACASGELKHGPIALIEDGITVISILTDASLVEKSISNIQEVITRGAKSVIVTNQNLNKDTFNFVVNIPTTPTELSPIVSIIPLQLFAYYIAKSKGLDVDKPRNLAKSVTVE